MAVGACRRVTAVVYVCGVKTSLTKPLRWLIVLHHKRVPQLIGAAQRAREAGETRESEPSLPNRWGVAVCNTVHAPCIRTLYGFTELGVKLYAVRFATGRPDTVQPYTGPLKPIRRVAHLAR